MRYGALFHNYFQKMIVNKLFGCRHFLMDTVKKLISKCSNKNAIILAPVNLMHKPLTLPARLNVEESGWVSTLFVL